ncbi:hypothetical protein OB905_13075 [Halobacteria archaeon AArc-dxtr1]|nr:hypothetical protein [Halobacteria archaeon AArc-dxtr1]
MSLKEVSRHGVEYLPVCAYCGTTIETAERDCPALDEGVCRP